MIRATAKRLFLSLLLPLAAVAQSPTGGGPGSNINRGDLLRNRQYQSNAAIALFVSTTGNDGNACTGTGTDACLTGDGALAKLPKEIKYPTTITYGAGTFAGSLITGFTFRPATNAGASLSLIGTLANVTPATGTATGTLTGATTGTNGTLTFGTATDSGQTWTVNDLRGKWLSITAGTGAGQVRAISSNTATAITIAGAWTTTPGAFGSSYAIVDPSTIIDTPANVPATPNSVTSATQGGRFVIYNLTAGREDGTSTNGSIIGTDVNFSNFLWTNTTTTIAVNVYSPRTAVRVSVSRPNGASGGVYRCSRGDCQIYLNNIVHSGSNSAIYSPLSGQGADEVELDQSVVVSTNAALFFSPARSTQIQNTSIILTSGSVIEDTGTSSGQKTVFVRGVSLDCGSSTGRFWRQNNSTLQLSASVYSFSTVDISNCGTALDFVGARGELITVTGTGNTIGLSQAAGSYALVSSGTTITGTTEISLDGTAYTWAGLRLLTPKQITDMGSLSSIVQR